MIEIWRNSTKGGREGLSAILLVFAAGFGTTFFYMIRNYIENGIGSPLSLVVFTIGGVIYLEGAFRSATRTEIRGLAGFSRAQFTLILFSLLLVIFIMQVAAGDIFFLWILAMPLAGDVDESYPTAPLNMLVYGLILASIMAGPALVFNWSLSGIVSTGLSMASGLLFVVVFSRLRRRERDTRIEAETLTEELESANLQLSQYAAQAEELATTKERNRIAREIHDNLGHYLTVVNVQLEASKILIDRDPDKARDAVGKAQKMTQEGLQSIRQSIHALRENAVENRPIHEAIGELCEAHRTGGVETTYRIVGEPRELDEKVKLTLYRVVQEGLTNSRKHSEATEVSVELAYNDVDSVRIVVEDNGKGSSGSESGFGLLGIRERLNILGGSLAVDSALEKGFKLKATIPLN